MDTKDAGKKGGQSRSEKKQAAARANGKRRGSTARPVTPAAPAPDPLPCVRPTRLLTLPKEGQ
jgi:hypothetical protein